MSNREGNSDRYCSRILVTELNGQPLGHMRLEMQHYWKASTSSLGSIAVKLLWRDFKLINNSVCDHLSGSGGCRKSGFWGWEVGRWDERVRWHAARNSHHRAGTNAAWPRPRATGNLWAIGSQWLRCLDHLPPFFYENKIRTTSRQGIRPSCRRDWKRWKARGRIASKTSFSERHRKPEGRVEPLN